MKTLRACVLVLICMGPLLAHAGDCSTSRKFQLPKPQVIAGALKDPTGAALYGVEFELLSPKTVIKRLRTDNDGHYDFGRIEVGTYRLRVEHGGKPFCAPEPRCDAEGCSFSEKLSLNPRALVQVD